MLVLRPGALGDTLLAVPALRALRRAYTPLRLAANGPAAHLLARLGEVDVGLAFDDPSLATIFSTHYREPVVAWMTAEVPAAIVQAPSRPPRMDRHCARYLLETLEALGIDLAWGDHPLAVAALETDEILIHPGSGSPRKNWPPERFAAVVRALAGPVRLVVGEADAAAADAIEACLGRPLSRLQPTLEELASRLAGCRAYLGNDSGVSHLAGLCGARTLVLFGASDPRVWRPLGPRVEVLELSAEPDEIARRLES